MTHLVGAEDELAAERYVAVAETELENDRADRAIQIVSLLSGLNVDHEVKQRVLKLPDRLDTVL